MAIKLGMDAKLYHVSGGGPIVSDMPAWDEIGDVRDVTLTVEAGEADVTTRGNNVWRARIGTLKDAEVTFEMIWDTANTAFAALLTAFLNKTALGVAVMDGPIGTTGSQGLWANMSVIKFNREEKLEDAIKASVTLKPTFSAIAPEWKTIV